MEHYPKFAANMIEATNEMNNQETIAKDKLNWVEAGINYQFGMKLHIHE